MYRSKKLLISITSRTNLVASTYIYAAQFALLLSLQWTVINVSMWSSKLNNLLAKHNEKSCKKDGRKSCKCFEVDWRLQLVSYVVLTLQNLCDSHTNTHKDRLIQTHMHSTQAAGLSYGHHQPLISAASMPHTCHSGDAYHLVHWTLASLVLTCLALSGINIT